MAFSPLERKVALLVQGIPLAEIARRAGVTDAHVSMVVSGDRRSPKTEAIIAEALGEPVEKVFEPREGAPLQEVS